MAFILADRVRETSTTAGTGSITLSGAVTGYQTFASVLTTGDTTYYTIADQTGSNWEVGIGTFTSPSTLARTTILSSSNAGSIVTFTSTIKDVFITLPASRAGASYTTYSYTATASQTTFAATYTPPNIQVFVNGVLLNSADYTATSGTSVVLSTGCNAGDIVDLISIIVGNVGVQGATGATGPTGPTGPAGPSLVTIDTTPISGGTSGYALYNNAGTVGSTNILSNFTLVTPTINDGYIEEVVTANTATAYTVSLTGGTLQILTLTGNCTFTFPTPTAGQSFTLFLKQDATGSRTATWPASVKWPSSTAPTITSTASKGDKYVFTADGTYWWGSTAGQNYL